MISRFLARFLCQRPGDRIAGPPRGRPDRDLSRRYAITLQQTPHASDQSVGLLRRSVVQQYTHVAFTKATDQITTAEMLAEARHTRLRHVWAERGITKGDDDSRNRDAVLYSIMGKTFKHFVEAVPRGAPVTDAWRLTNELLDPRLEQISRDLDDMVLLRRHRVIG